MNCPIAGEEDVSTMLFLHSNSPLVYYRDFDRRALLCAWKLIKRAAFVMKVPFLSSPPSDNIRTFFFFPFPEIPFYLGTF